MIEENASKTQEKHINARGTEKKRKDTERCHTRRLTWEKENARHSETQEMSLLYPAQCYLCAFLLFFFFFVLRMCDFSVSLGVVGGITGSCSSAFPPSTTMP